MLSRSAASGSSQAQSRELLRTFTRPSGSRQLRGAASQLTLTQQRTLVHKAPRLIASKSSSSSKNNTGYPTTRCQSQRRFVSGPASAEAPSPQPTEPIETDELAMLIDRVGDGGVEINALVDELETLSLESAQSPEASEIVEQDELAFLWDRVSANADQINEMLDDLEAGYQNEHEDVAELLAQRHEHTAESFVHLVRQRFRDGVPGGLLDEEEIQIYIRLYGGPVPRLDLDAMAEEDGFVEEEEEPSLLREDGQGGWEEVDMDQADMNQEPTPQHDPSVVYDMDAPPQRPETDAERRTREVTSQMGGKDELEAFENEAVPDPTPRADPNTLIGKFGTDPTTINLPRTTLTGPISIVLSNYSNKHITETSERLFGGHGLPQSTSTAAPSAQLAQKPVPLDASQRHMGEMEANAYLAVLYPGIYASTLSALVETRKRLGDDWIRELLSQKGGPNVLDASGGGAGILAWRDLVRTQWDLMSSESTQSVPIPGRSTVVAGSEALRMRAAALLENTSFLPRLPDYVHVREKPTFEDSREAPKRKQYDVIIAPHSIQRLGENYERKEHVENLWAMLNPNGGVLILLEKGRQRGFEAISGAREMLLQRHIASPGSTEFDNFLDNPDERVIIKKEPGMIIAPCTNHQTCPMHGFSGTAVGRRDHCSFQQRYIRPPFLQRILGAKGRNHEDVKFSYLSVRRGGDIRQDRAIQQNQKATDSAFEGYTSLEDLEGKLPASDGKVPFEPLSLPRAVYAPMKRQGHVIFDLCTPAGKIERWTVPRSFGKQAYRDARKAEWGDLWALGAKTRISRNLQLGGKHEEGKKERLARRAAERQIEDENEDVNENDEFEEDDEADYEASDLPEEPQKKRGQRVPSWKKHNEKKKVRQAYKKRDISE